MDVAVRLRRRAQGCRTRCPGIAHDGPIDLGPEGGHDGGRVQFTGMMTELVETDPLTGLYLKRWLDEG